MWSLGVVFITFFQLFCHWTITFIIPLAQRSWRGLYWFYLVHLSVCLSICGQNRVCSVSSTILARSILYSHILLSKFRRRVLCKVYFKIWNFGEFFVTLTLSCFDLDPIWLNSMGDHGAAGGYPENADVLVVLVKPFACWAITFIETFACWAITFIQPFSHWAITFIKPFSCCCITVIKTFFCWAITFIKTFACCHHLY